MHEDDAFFYFQIARNIAETGRASFDGTDLTNGFHPLWMGLLGLGTMGFAAVGIPPEAALILAAALPLAALGALCHPIFFAMVLAAAYLCGFGMEGVLGAVLFLAFARAADLRRTAWVAGLSALIVMTRIDFSLCLVIYAIWFMGSRRKQAIAIVAGIGIGVLATILINDALVGAFFSVSSAQKAALARHLAGVDLLFDNLSSPGNMVRLGLWLGALGMLALMRPLPGPRQAPVLLHPVFHLGLAAFLMMHATASFLRDWYFAAPVMVALVAAAQLRVWGRHLAPGMILCLALPLAGIAFQMGRFAEASAGYAQFLDDLPPGEGPIFAYDGSGYAAFRLHPVPVINGDGLVNTPEFARNAHDPEWLAAYLDTRGVRRFLTNPGYTACVTPSHCCADAAVEEIADWRSTHPYLANRLWRFRGQACLPAQ